MKTIISNYLEITNGFLLLKKYLDLKGISCEDDDPYISENESLEITDLNEFVQAIDETVFYDIIHKNHDSQKSEDPLSVFERYSEYFNFSENFVCLDDTGAKVIPHTSIYQAMSNAFNNSYVFQSCRFVQWLSEHNAIIDKQAVWTKHRYNLEAGQEKNITILGKLNPDYKLTLSYW